MLHYNHATALLYSFVPRKTRRMSNLAYLSLGKITHPPRWHYILVRTVFTSCMCVFKWSWI